jgi:hypothetical protein
MHMTDAISEKKTREKMAEQQAAALVVAYLKDLGLDVYQEVSFGDRLQIADIVAVREGREIWIVEVKASWSLDLLEQLRIHRRFGRAHRIFAAVPARKNAHYRASLFRECGFGYIEIHEEGTSGYLHTKIETMAPRITSQPLPKVLAKLEEGHKTHAKAGAPGAKGRWSPFRATCEALLEVVKKNPGICLSAAMGQIKHHYRSDAGARSSIAVWVKRGSVPGVQVYRQGRILALYPSDHPLPIQEIKKREDPLPEWAQSATLETGA